ncbi:MAG: phosphoribosylamine--glycine ligase [Cytophagales bacterium]|nr:phosphoribosylamine--glycine ligase [Cytophagales bacterium]
MNILVIGGGGREHALAWKLAASPRVQMVYVAPGNGGTALDSRLHNLPITDNHELAQWALDNKINLTVVGPEAPLAAGVVDLFRSKGLRIFGPTQAAAQLESSKAFSKAFMARHGIATAHYAVFTDDTLAAAHAYVDKYGAPIVVKADGLAAGKGVVVAMTLEEAHDAVQAMIGVGCAAGSRIVIEEFLSGEEASFIVLCDGKNVTALATSQDHKRIGDGDTGANTGGMGAYSPAPVVTPDIHARVLREVMIPTMKGMAKDGITYTGFLYAGLMIGKSADGKTTIQTLEFNCRLGDPETQPILLRLKSDLVSVLLAATDARLDTVDLEWDRRTALGVVIAAHGYPATPRTGDVIRGIPHLAPETEVQVFHAGSQRNAAGDLVTSGGRILCVTALAQTVKAAQMHAYEVVQHIQIDGAQYRTDIGHRALIG